LISMSVRPLGSRDLWIVGLPGSEFSESPGSLVSSEADGMPGSNWMGLFTVIIGKHYSSLSSASLLSSFPAPAVFGTASPVAFGADTAFLVFTSFLASVEGSGMTDLI